jgi:hypothetical protein
LWKVGVKTGGRVIGEPASSVGAGEYFLDYDADKVYLGSDPTGHRVDAAVVTDVFRSEAVNVRISGLTVEMAAGIGIRALGGWTLEGNDVRVNAQKGIVANDGTRVVGNSIHHNGAYGITGSGSGVVVENNDVSFNNISRLDTVQGTCNANGGSKFYHTVGAVIRNNNFHDNLCNGIWLDINNYDAIVEGNRVLDNRGHGISFEISYKALIRNNVVEGNDGWGVLVRDSPDVQIEGNTIGANVNGPVMLFNKGRTDHSSSYGPHVTKNVSVSGNKMTVPNGKGVKLGAVDTAGGSMLRSNIRFFDNAYTVGSATARSFKWNGQGLTYLQWKAAGLDTRGTFTVAAAKR